MEYGLSRKKFHFSQKEAAAPLLCATAPYSASPPDPAVIQYITTRKTDWLNIESLAFVIGSGTQSKKDFSGMSVILIHTAHSLQHLIYRYI